MQRPNMDILRARKLPGGEVAFITNQNLYTRMDAKTQKVVHNFNIGPVQLLWGTMEILPNGNVIVPHYNQQRVVEYNDKGQQVGNPIQINWPNSVARLPSGNTLVTSYQQRQVFEYNANNQQVWAYQTDGNVFVARRR